ncbi:hypothetical protein JDV02_010717 [Purpureocillium takamizusanense]|uniref:DUF7730 domain-containing protein n=1 Tax=Purpureocillium takamizusanense TaxID=2060973 RepID=A0A9Q8VGU9_9HYPO|nr:uncharacterized protein JDV02_010717 [Purpureocillium takamizusanense]UNI25008.1 hypothetical protein JDV02_010717 [Purpureocillium takamizusanense]
MAMSMLERLSSRKFDSPHQGAGFFRLPPEVRSTIYDYAFDENVLHIWRAWIAGQVHCQAYRCIDDLDCRQGYSHSLCDSLEEPAHLLGLPFACRQLYIETIQHVYSRFTISIQADLLRKWSDITPAVHMNAVTSLRTTLTRPEEGETEYQKVWELVSKLPNLRNLLVKIIGCETYDGWTPEIQEQVATPIKAVQQPCLETFDLVFVVEGTWFPDDCYLRLQYNGLEWDTFVMDQSQCPAFKGVHPRCRMVGMKSFLHNHPITDNMPTEAELVRWICYFSCSCAYGSPDPEGYDWDEVGQSAQHGFADWEERIAEGRRQYQALMEERDEIGGRGKWNRADMNRIANLMDDNIQRPNRFKWKYPERPSWIKQTTDRVS